MKMMVYNYRSGKEIIPARIADGVKDVVEAMDYKLGKYDIKRFRDDLAIQMLKQGWPGQVTLFSKSSISITSILENIGLCIQTGNVARMYADLMKLQALFLDDKIKAAILIVPMKKCARLIGSNIVYYERLLNELVNVFSKVITVPILVIGFENTEE